MIRIYKNDSYAFPRKNFEPGQEPSVEDFESHSKYRFVQKIIEIDYQDAVPDAISDYLRTVRTLNNDFARLHITRERTDSYISDLTSVFELRRRIECRRSNPTNVDAQNFYDKFISEEAREFAGMEIPPRGFKNGLLHTQVDDESKGLVWKLEKR